MPSIHSFRSMKRKASYADKRPSKKSRQNTTRAIVRKEINKRIDWKYTDVGVNAQNVSSAGTLGSLYFNMSRGDAGHNQFEGNWIRPSGIYLKYYIHTSELRNVVRVMLFQWMDATVPVPSGILQDVTTGFGVIAPTLVTNRNYIRVLYDRSHQIAPTAGDAGALGGEGTTDVCKVYIPGRKLRKTRFQSNANQVQQGDIYVLVISDDLAIPQPQITWWGRVTFSDSL